MDTNESRDIENVMTTKESRNKVFSYIEDVCKTRLVKKEEQTDQQITFSNPNSLLIYYGNLLLAPQKI